MTFGSALETRTHFLGEVFDSGGSCTIIVVFGALPRRLHHIDEVVVAGAGTA